MILTSSDMPDRPNSLDQKATAENGDDPFHCDAGEKEALANLVALMYPELKRIASQRMRGERPDHTLQATSLVNEFFLRLARHKNIAWRSRTHFLAVASRLMRQVLIDYARFHNAQIRGGTRVKVQFTDIDVPGTANAFDVLIMNELMDRLKELDRWAAAVAEMRLYGELSHAEIAEIIGKDERTVKRYWKFAREWIIDQLRTGHGDAGERLAVDK